MTVKTWFSALALLGLLALAGCASNPPTGQTPTPTTPASRGTPTQQSTSLELAFIGGDGNVWDMTWPGGAPKQWTTDAQANQVRYSGLAWSPDGKRLAVLRETGPRSNPTGDTLVLFAPGGSTQAKYTLIGRPYNTPFSWSPDGTLIAYRTTTNQFDAATGDIKGRLTILDAKTGATKQSLLYDNGTGGCGGAFPPLVEAVMEAHQAFQGIDTFVWTPNQQGLLVARGCGNDSAGLVDLGNQSTTGGYPAGASYQPGGNLVILGLWSHDATITLGLGNATGTQLRVFLTANFSSKYATTLGTPTWTPDGQNIYFEHNNGIWTMDANGANAQQVIAGATNNSQNQATVAMLPSLSPDGSLLLYLQLHGDNGQPGAGSVSAQCYVARPDGSQATALPRGASSAAWRPVK
jgi:Tol biopolymer transport system component